MSNQVRFNVTPAEARELAARLIAAADRVDAHKQTDGYMYVGLNETTAGPGVSARVGTN